MKIFFCLCEEDSKVLKLLNTDIVFQLTMKHTAILKIKFSLAKKKRQYSLALKAKKSRSYTYQN